MNLTEALDLLNANMEKIESFHVEKIGIFGSIVRGEQTPMSDVDILVEFDPSQETFDHYMDLKFFLEELFDCPVDLVITGTIKEALRKSIEESVKYAKGA